MADDAQYSSGSDITTHKRKYEEPSVPQSATHRPTGFSAPIASQSPDSAHQPPPSYNSVPPPVDGLQLAKQRAQEVAARLLNNANGGAVAAGFDAKRPKVENGATGFDSTEKGFSSAPSDVKPQYSTPSSMPVSYGYQGTTKKIDIPNGRVGVIIGKGGETIKYLQTQSGAKIQVTRDMDADPNSPTRMVELMGTQDQIATAERLINEVLAEAESGGSGIVSRRLTSQAGSEQFVMKIPNNKVGLVIGKGGDTIKNMQAQTGARIQIIPLHLPPGDTSTERTVQIDGTSEQIESAKQLVNEVISENRVRNPVMAGGYSQQGYQARPPSGWGTPGAPMQQPGYGYMQPGAYSGPPSQYNMSQPPYPGYPPQPSSGYAGNWDQSSVPSTQQPNQGSGYDYYGQHAHSEQQQNPATTADNGYNYSQPPSSGYNQSGQSYTQDSYSGYHAPPQSGYGQPLPYNQQQGYGSAPSYGGSTNSGQEGQTSNYGSQGDSSQAPAPVQSSMAQQGYATGQQSSSNPSNYPPQGATQPGYGVPPTSQAPYGNPPPMQSGYGVAYGPPQPQKPGPNTPVYGQSAQSPSTPGGYGLHGQPVYPHSQPPPSAGYAQPDAGSQRAPPAGYGAAAAQPGYGAPAYGAVSASQAGYGQAPPYGGTSYGGAYSQPPAYSGDSSASGSTRGYEAPAPPQTVQQGGVTKASPQS